MHTRRRATAHRCVARGALAAGLLAAALAASAQGTPAPAPAGTVKRVAGPVEVERAGQVIELQPGAPVRVGDRLRTGPGGHVGLTMADDTLLTVGPQSVLVISEFAFDPTTHEGSLFTTLLKGTLHWVTGLIGRQAPQQVGVRTRTAVLGVRGTEFIVETAGD